MLITAGPTHEPIDAVRFLGNRSSGRVGVSLAAAAAARGWNVLFMLGPVGMVSELQQLQESFSSQVTVLGFRTCADLQTLLEQHVHKASVLVMAAAVADYRPKIDPSNFNGKFRRTSTPLHLELEPTPDLLAQVAATRRPDQFMVGFALEPRDELLASAQSKLVRKKIHMVVANPLETMDSSTIEATLLREDGSFEHTPGTITKQAFAPWLVERIELAAAALTVSQARQS